MARGCEWLIGASADGAVLVPEALSAEHRLIARTAEEFVRQEVSPALPALENKQWDVARRLLQQAGDLGLIGADMPERVGGTGLDKAAALIVTEALGACPSFSIAFGAQSGLAPFPILGFGTPEQQQRYLPGLMRGEIVGAYCLSESGSGSDALGARARATRLPDGSWSLSGEKMWISSGGFADLFVVFAKVDGAHFSAFLVERGFPGVSTGKEEHKMGLRGSSTTSLVLEEARVPASHLLGEVGKGHKVAFGVLNYGRFKLGAMCSGGAKAALADAVRYANGRRQFGRAIASFGAIRQKLAQMTARVYAVESMLYRLAGLVDEAIEDASDGASVARAMEEFAIEASLVKVASSEAIDFVVDENVQIHGGNGFVTDYAAEGRYRDARVNRIFEGTNEINRLAAPAQLVRRITAGAVALSDAASRAEDRVRGRRTREPAQDGLGDSVQGIRDVAMLVLGRARSCLGDRLAEEQEVVMIVADLMIEAFAADCVVRRAALARTTARAALHADAAQVYVHRAALRVQNAARTALPALDAGGDARPALDALPDLAPVPAGNVIAAARRIADAVTASPRYIFSVSS